MTRIVLKTGELKARVLGVRVHLRIDDAAFSSRWRLAAPPPWYDVINLVEAIGFAISQAEAESFTADELVAFGVTAALSDSLSVSESYDPTMLFSSTVGEAFSIDESFFIIVLGATRRVIGGHSIGTSSLG